MDCYLCGRPAIGECQRCGNPYCAAHGNRLCSRCVAPSGGLASPRLYRSALVVLILAIASAGWFLHAWPWPSASPQKETSIVSSAPSEATPAPVAEPTQIPTPTPVATVTSIQYIVQQGDTLLDIALKYGTTVEAITSLNGITDPQALKIGQVLLIPVTAPAAAVMPTAIPASTIRYVVEPGDSLVYIAIKYNTTVEAIAALNGLASVHELQVGQVLLIPK